MDWTARVFDVVLELGLDQSPTVALDRTSFVTLYGY